MKLRKLGKLQYKYIKVNPELLIDLLSQSGFIPKDSKSIDLRITKLAGDKLVEFCIISREWKEK